MLVNCLLTASPYPLCHLDNLMQSLTTSTHSHTDLTLSTGHSEGCINFHSSFLCSLSPLLSSLLLLSPSRTTIILMPTASLNSLLLAKQLIYTGECKGTQDQVEAAAQLLDLLGVKIEYRVSSCFTDCFTEDDTVFIQSESISDLVVVNKEEGDMAKLKIKKTVKLPIVKTHTQEILPSLVSADEGFNTMELDDNDVESDASCGTSDILLSDEEFDAELEAVSYKQEDTNIMKKSFPCNQCNYIATQRGNLKRHIQALNCRNEEDPKLKQNQLSCSQCDYIATQRGHLKRHVASIHRLERLKCNLCEKTFSVKETLNRHLLSFHEDQNYPCPECEFVAARQENLKYHVQCKHSMAMETCDECEFQAATARLIKRHKRRDHEGLNYSCGECDYQASDKSSLKYHMMATHEKIRYQCDVCSRKFTRKTSLKKHIILKHSVNN